VLLARIGGVSELVDLNEVVASFDELEEPAWR
jgi:hypothetical protein